MGMLEDSPTERYLAAKFRLKALSSLSACQLSFCRQLSFSKLSCNRPRIISLLNMFCVAVNFDSVVDQLVSMIDSGTTEAACHTACVGAAATILGPAAALAGSVCDPACKASVDISCVCLIMVLNTRVTHNVLQSSFSSTLTASVSTPVF